MKVFIIILCGLFVMPLSSAQSSDWAEKSLESLSKDAQKYQKSLPQKKNQKGEITSALNPLFRAKDLKQNRFAEKKIQWRKSKFAIPFGRSPFADLGTGSLAEKLVDLSVQPLMKSLEQLESNGLMRARLEDTPWSGDYWAISRGVLGARPFVREFNNLESWQTRLDWIRQFLFIDIFKKGDQVEINKLSIAEKVDLIFGDENAGFTTYMWNQGYLYKDENGDVEDWMGICHGWAPAAYMIPRPIHSFEVKSADGNQDIKIYPSELKGLITQLWAIAPFETTHIGGRCNKKDPERDESGRIVEPDCFDINPGTWHLSVTNQLGRAKRSFIFDVTYDYEVWNHPVYAYEYRYFNPETKKTAKTIAGAEIKASDYVSDPFKKYRTSGVDKIVGIAMRVGYIVELGAGNREIESADWDQIHWVDYLYDLEIDSKGEISGGEWYSQAHPDFLWGAAPNARPYSPIDNHLNAAAWDPKQPVPDLWRQMFTQISGYGYMAGKFLDILVEQSRTEGEAELIPEEQP